MIYVLKRSKWFLDSDGFIRIWGSAHRHEELLSDSKRAENRNNMFGSWVRYPLTSRQSEEYGDECDAATVFGCFFFSFGIRIHQYRSPIIKLRIGQSKAMCLAHNCLFSAHIFLHHRTSFLIADKAM